MRSLFPHWLEEKKEAKTLYETASEEFLVRFAGVWAAMDDTFIYYRERAPEYGARCNEPILLPQNRFVLLRKKEQQAAEALS